MNDDEPWSLIGCHDNPAIHSLTPRDFRCVDAASVWLIKNQRRSDENCHLWRGHVESDFLYVGTLQKVSSKVGRTHRSSHSAKDMAMPSAIKLNLLQYACIGRRTQAKALGQWPSVTVRLLDMQYPQTSGGNDAKVMQL